MEGLDRKEYITKLAKAETEEEKKALTAGDKLHLE